MSDKRAIAREYAKLTEGRGMSETAICTARYLPPGDEWHTVRCSRPAKVEARRGSSPPGGAAWWAPMCGIHARRYAHKRPISDPSEQTPVTQEEVR